MTGIAWLWLCPMRTGSDGFEEPAAMDCRSSEAGAHNSYPTMDGRKLLEIQAVYDIGLNIF